MRLLAALVFSAAAAGCDACDDRSGTYTVEYVETGGTCGNMRPATLYFHNQPDAVPEPCTDGEVRHSDDNCEMTNINVACPEDSIRGEVMITNGKYTWNADGAAGFGSVTITVQAANGRVRCQGSYDVTITRL